MTLESSIMMRLTFLHRDAKVISSRKMLRFDSETLRQEEEMQICNDLTLAIQNIKVIPPWRNVGDLKVLQIGMDPYFLIIP